MFDCIPVPTPFSIGRVNTYVAGRTVVDPGPDSERAWSTLVDGLADHGLDPRDVEQVLVTHAHIDHFGLAGRLRDHGARIVASPEAADVIADYPARLAYEQSYFAPFFERCGVDPDIVETVVTLPDPFLTYACSVETDVEVTTGDTLTVAGETIEVDAIEGHGPGELLFTYEDEGERQAIVGDSVLEDVTPNPLLQPPSEAGGERPRQLLKYNRTLTRLEGEAYDRLLPGHGDVIDEPNTRIREILDANERRTAEVRDLVDGPTLPVTVMNGLFGDLSVTRMFAGMSEAVGHLDVLEARGEVARSARDSTAEDTIRYERTTRP